MFAISTFLAMALRLNQGYFPDIMLYIICGPMAGVLEKALTGLPTNIIMSQVIAPGVEATMFAVAHTIMNLNMFTLRALVGVFINDNFVFVTKENMENFYVLQIIALCGTLIPFFYIHLLIPTQKDVRECASKNL